MTLELVETQKLEQALEAMRSVQRDGDACAQLIRAIPTTTDAELLARWRPVLQQTVDELIVAAEALRACRELSAPGWSGRNPQLLPTLLTVSTKLATLHQQLTLAQTEGQARDLMVRVRREVLGPRPRHTRRTYDA